MPHPHRHDFAGTTHHVILRARNREVVFAHDGDRWSYLTLLKRYTEECGCIVHAWTLLANHVHLLLSVTQDHGLARCLRLVNGIYSRQINRDRQRMGNNWQAHAQIKPVVFDEYFINCHLYIEGNAVKAGLVEEPMDYRWSSCRHHCLGLPDGLTSPNAWYDSLGKTSRQRQTVYQALLSDYVDRLRQEMALGGVQPGK